MFKFIKKILLFLLPLLIIISIKKATTPYQLGNPKFAEKLSYFQENQEQFNTLIFGSSRILHQVNPLVLDSCLIEKNIHSYNFASSATYNPESYFLYENFIKEAKNNQFKYAILEIQDVNLSFSNSVTTQGSYWNTLCYLIFSLKYVYNSNKSPLFNIQRMLILLKSFGYSMIDFNILKDNELHEDKILNQEVHGFYPYDKYLNNPNKKRAQNRWKNFHSDTTQLTKRIHASSQIDFSKSKFNSTHYEKLSDLISMSKDKGIELIFVLPPRLVEGAYPELVPVLNRLPQKNVISLYDYQKFSELYLAENSFDIAHLNAKGADIFSKYLADMMNEKISAR